VKDKLTILISLSATDDAIDRLRRVCPSADIRIGPWITTFDQKLDASLLQGVDILLCEIPPTNFDDFDQLKWMQLTSAGYNHVLHLPLLERGIRVTNGLGNFDGPIGQWCNMMMLMWHREMLEQLANQKEKIWSQDGRYQRDIYGSTIGFWGYGGIARETARLAKSMGVTVHALTRDGKTRRRDMTYCVAGTGDPEGVLPDRVFAPSQLKEFLGGLDYLFLGMALTDETTGIIGEAELRMLKPSAVLINPTRAAIIEEQAMIRCMSEKWIRGASLDVHYAYPLPPEHPLWSMQNVILTPHISGSSASSHFMTRIYDIFGQNLARYINTRPLLNELTDAQLRGK